MYSVLIVEDDPMVAMINEHYVLKNKDYVVAGTCKNGQDAISFLEKNSVDLVILDVYMPYMNGIETLKKIREMKIKCEVIMVTAANDTPTLEETMHLGVIDYLIKPFAFERFQVALEKFSSKVNALKQTSVLNQNYVDSIFSNNEKVGAKGYPKGIQEKTLQRIQKFFEIEENCGWITAEIIAENLGVSVVTVRTYMNYLIKQGKIQETVNYETGGRPSTLYRQCHSQN